MRGWAQLPPAGLHSGTGPGDTKETWPKAPSAGGQAEAGRELALPWEMKGFLEKAGPLSWLRASSLEAVVSDDFQMEKEALGQAGGRRRGKREEEEEGEEEEGQGGSWTRGPQGPRLEGEERVRAAHP